MLVNYLQTSYLSDSDSFSAFIYSPPILNEMDEIPLPTDLSVDNTPSTLIELEPPIENPPQIINSTNEEHQPIRLKYKLLLILFFN